MQKIVAKGSRLPHQLRATTRKFTIRVSHDAAYAIAEANKAIQEHIQDFMIENGGRKACCHCVALRPGGLVVYELRDIQGCPLCAYKTLNPLPHEFAPPRFSAGEV